MKTRISLFIMMFALVPVLLQAQATKSIPLGKKGTIGIDTHIPVQPDMSAVSASVNRQLAEAAAQAHRAKAGRPVAPTTADLQVRKGDVPDEKDYVVTPAGDIKKGSWEACEYFYKWEQRQTELNTDENQRVSNRELVFTQFDISDEYCQVLAQQHLTPRLEKVNVAQVAAVPIVQPNLAVNLQPNVKLPEINLAHITEPVVTGENSQETASATVEPARFSWTELRHADEDFTPNDLTPRKTKRYLKHFVRDHYTDLAAALSAKQAGTRLNIGQRRLLTSYDSLCGWYEHTHPQEKCPPPESFL